MDNEKTEEEEDKKTYPRCSVFLVFKTPVLETSLKT